MASFDVLLTFCAILASWIRTSATIDPDTRKNFTQFVASRGYVSEVYQVTTEDNYILGVFRVMCQRNCHPDKVVYISTPLFMDGDVFVADYANNSLAYLLADAGYDVWIGNCRGTKYSRRSTHTPFPSSLDTGFFDYTLIDIGLKDIPAGIDFVLAKTGIQKLFYLGHSQATAGFFALLSEKPEYNDKVAAMVAMAPFRRLACNIGQDEQLGILSWIAHNYVALKALICNLGEFPPKFISFGTICRLLPNTCDFGFHLAVGPTPNLNTSRIDVYSNFIPASTSVKNLILMAQMSTRDCHGDSGVYDFDYDDYKCGGIRQLFAPKLSNENIYASRMPRQFFAEKIQLPVRLYCAANDGYASSMEVARLESELPNYRGTFELSGAYGHYDLIVPTYNSCHVMDAIEFMDSFIQIDNAQ